ncbi:cupin [Clostridium kluyveri]|uniref:Cupin n=2 Tax=Clostridium kluyveri TaxID=1534 RepID=A0A1L5F350_CLOKL|nr:cupin domain-containing protein [Clostridium kluyveri]APM37426.1 cupin [Clostridium kluyveri]
MNIPNEENVNLESLVEYQRGKLVSLPIAQLPNINIILLAIDQGQGEAINAHSAPGDALLQILDGAAEITIGEKTLTVKKGESVVMPANVPHALAARERFKILLTFIK